MALKLNIQDIGSAALTFAIGRMVGPGTDWKKLAMQKGMDFVKAEIAKLAKAKITKGSASLAIAMEQEGWSWAAAKDPRFLDAQKVDPDERGKGAIHVISRDMIYSQFRSLGVPGGAVRDGWRDAVDDGTSELVTPRVKEGETRLQDVAAITGEELVNLIL